MAIPGTLFKAIGGQDVVDEIVTAHYKHISKHPELIPIFPTDLEESARKQNLFLTQFLGGPQIYLEERGHPMLRRRHLPFSITPDRKDAWLECFDHALMDAEIEEPYRTAIFDRISIAATHMINTLDI